MKVIILIGLPGSGKTTWAKQFQNGSRYIEIVSSDDFFTKPDGAYIWTKETAHLGHEQCLRSFIEALQGVEDGISDATTVIVDNTNVKLEDVAPYVRIAQAYRADLEVKWIRHGLDDCIKRNTHGVPVPVFVKMSGALMTLMVEWPKSFPVIETVEK
jgi:predicted kinase